MKSLNLFSRNPLDTDKNTDRLALPKFSLVLVWLSSELVREYWKQKSSAFDFSG
ncbi:MULTISPECIES: hypothetical protein [unclassified Bradyrhizobium]|uniref:hypothetical protein n=1 Tax=unclassified Bradyrhizobium TaxID=2631580 RepID=UPI000B2DEE5E|nr:MULTISPECIES: hypothetical protein [unclassified Bradyrhizobium]